MTIEQKCNYFIRVINDFISLDEDMLYLIAEDITKWIWFGKPNSLIYDAYLHPNREVQSKYLRCNTALNFQIESYIEDCDPVECLTSNSEYIRECKKWLMENK